MSGTTYICVKCDRPIEWGEETVVTLPSDEKDLHVRLRLWVLQTEVAGALLEIAQGIYHAECWDEERASNGRADEEVLDAVPLPEVEPEDSARSAN